MFLKCLYFTCDATARANIKCFLHHSFGLIILPMKSVSCVLRSVMITINGRLNFKAGIRRRDRSVMLMPVDAVAVAPASSTSRVALCTTWGTVEAEWDESWMKYSEGNMHAITPAHCPYLWDCQSLQIWNATQVCMIIKHVCHSHFSQHIIQLVGTLDGELWNIYVISPKKLGNRQTYSVWADSSNWSDRTKMSGLTCV